jgi:hypothetical protein
MKKVEQKFVHPPFQIGWHHLRFTLPLTWEVTSYTTNTDEGTMGFASEKGPHGQVSWRKVKAVPDKEKIMTEVHRRYISETDPDKAEAFSSLNFFTVNDIVVGYEKKGERYYASTFLKEPNILVEWIFPDYSQKNFSKVKSLLASFRENKPEDGRLFFGCWGLEIKIPEGFHLSKISSLPAAVSVEFENKKCHRIVAHRWGMPQLLLEDSDLTSFYHKFLYSQCRFVIKDTKDTLFFNDKPGSIIEFKTRGKWGFDFLLGPWWRGYATCYLNEDEQRIYALEHIAPARFKQRETVEDVHKGVK